MGRYSHVLGSVVLGGYYYFESWSK
jgi:hypothetical protein